MMAGMQGDWATAAVAAALAGAVLGFLRYNFPPSTIFLGDGGSMLIGLVVGVLAIQSSLKAPAPVALAAPASLLVIPIFDTVAAIVRRKLTGRSIYCTDRGHLHHCLLRRGLSSRWALLVISSLSLVAAGGALASLALKNEALAVLAAADVVATLVLTRLFGHAELVLLRKRVTSVAATWLARPSADQSRQEEVRLEGSADSGDLLDRDLKDKRKKYREFRDNTPLVAEATPKDGVTPTQARLGELEAKRLALLVRIAELEERLRAIENARNLGTTREVVQALSAPTADKAGGVNHEAALRAQFLPLILEEQSLLEDFGEEHPQVKAIRRRI